MTDTPEPRQLLDSPVPDDVTSPASQGAASSPVSDKQLAANRRNAQLSTGPRTAEGKVTASKNRVIHGIFMEQTSAIRRGRFREDVSEVADFVNAILDALDPRDQIECCEARRVASAYLRFERLDHYENEAVGVVEGVAATKVLNGSLEQALKLRARLDRSLASAIARYDKLRERVEVDPSAPLQ